MKKFIIAALLFGGAYYYYTSAHTDDVSYSLASVEQNPIPKQHFYKLWNDVALKACADAHSRHNLTPEECREKVKEKFDICESDVLARTPEIVDSKSQVTRLGKAYMSCVTPSFYCNGIEVKTEEEAKRYYS